MCQISALSLLKCGFTAPKIAKIANFWYIFAKNGYTPLSDFFIKFGLGEKVAGPHPHAEFHHCGFKIWAYSPKIAKIGIFGIHLPKRGIAPYAIF